MKSMRTILLLGSRACVCSFLLLNITAFAQHYSLNGQVLDKHNSPVAGVLIRLYHEDKKLSGEFRTGSDGKYAIGFDPGDTITTVRYDLTNWDTCTVQNISGARSHTINKVMVRAGVSRSAAERQELIATLERIYKIDRANGVSDAEFKATYDAIVEQAGLSREQFAWMAVPRPPAPTDPRHKQNIMLGKYEGVAKSDQMGDIPLTVEIKNDNGRLSGKIDTPQGPAAITSGTYADGKITMKFDAGVNEGTVTAAVLGDKISGKWELGGQGGPLELKRSGAAAAGGEIRKEEMKPATRFPPGDPVSGEWDASADAQGTSITFKLYLKLDGDQVTGSAESAQGFLPIGKGTFVANRLNLSLETPNGAIVLTGSIKDGKIVGEFDLASQATGKWEAKKK